MARTRTHTTTRSHTDANRFYLFGSFSVPAKLVCFAFAAIKVMPVFLDEKLCDFIEPFTAIFIACTYIKFFVPAPAAYRLMPPFECCKDISHPLTQWLHSFMSSSSTFAVIQFEIQFEFRFSCRSRERERKKQEHK